ncbi:MAG: NAD(+)/NADH kinase [Anaerolineales bacterium]
MTHESKPITRIGFLAHPTRPETAQIADELATAARAQGVDVWQRAQWTEDDTQDLIPGSDMVVSIGGDGAVLHVSRLCAPHHVPVFGVNMGYLGFLTEARPDKWPTCLGALLEGRYWVESRLMIQGEIHRDGTCILSEDALNDVVISRGAQAKTVYLSAYIDGQWATNYHADGLIVATATGSTAYALAAGGPILPPELDNILMVPVAPHFSMERPVVLAQGVTVKLIISPKTRAETVVTIDGRITATLTDHDEVHVQVSPNRSRFIRLQDRNYFYRSLMERIEPRFATNTPPHEPDSEE